MPARLLLLNTDLELGGTPTVVRELAVRLFRDGVDVEVACLSPGGPVAGQIEASGVRVTPLHARGPTDLAVLARLVRLVRHRRPTTVLSLLMHANAAAAVASLRVPGVRWVQSIQTTQPTPRWHWPVQRLAAVRATAVVVPSPSVATIATAWAGFASEKVIVIPNAVDVSDYDAPGVRAGLPIVFLGRLDPVKDVPTLVAATGLLENVRLDIYGDGPDRPRIAAVIVRLGLGDRVTLRGPVARPQEAFAAAGVLVLPSLAEGFGLVLIEAMAAGVPVVATDVPGIRDVVADGVTGLLVPPGDPASMATAIRRLVEDRPLRERLVAAAAVDVRRRFAWDAVLPRYRDVLRV